jgi:MFS family permease
MVGNKRNLKNIRLLRDPEQQNKFWKTPMSTTSEIALNFVVERKLYSKIAWRIIPLLMICLLFSWFDRINIGFVKFDMQHSFPLSNTAYGLGASLFVVGYILFEVPSNLMLSRVGARRHFARILIVWGLASAAMMFVHSTAEFYALRFIIGGAEAGFTPGIFLYLSTWFPEHRRGRIYGVLYQAVAFSGILGAPLSGLILTHFGGLGGLPAWNWVFLIGGIPCVFLGGLILFCLEDNFESANWLSTQEKAQLRKEMVVHISDVRARPASSTLAALRSSGFLVVSLVWFLTQIAAFGMNYWTPFIVRHAGFVNREVIGLITAIPYLCGAASMLMVGVIADRIGNRRMVFFGCLIAAGIGFLLVGLFPHNTLLMMLSLGLIGAGVLTAYTTFWSLPPKIVTGAAAASGIAVINCIGQLGGIVSPIMVGKIIDATGNITAALYLIAAVCAVCALVTFFLFPSALRRIEQPVVAQNKRKATV